MRDWQKNWQRIGIGYRWLVHAIGRQINIANVLVIAVIGQRPYTQDGLLASRVSGPVCQASLDADISGNFVHSTSKVGVHLVGLTPKLVNWLWPHEHSWPCCYSHYDTGH